MDKLVIVLVVEVVVQDPQEVTPLTQPGMEGWEVMVFGFGLVHLLVSGLLVVEGVEPMEGEMTELTNRALASHLGLEGMVDFLTLPQRMLSQILVAAVVGVLVVEPEPMDPVDLWF